MSTVPDHMDRVEKQAIVECLAHTLAVMDNLTRPDGTAYGDIIIDTPEERILWFMDLNRRPLPEINIMAFLPFIDEWAKSSNQKFVGMTAEEYREQFEHDVAKAEL